MNSPSDVCQVNDVHSRLNATRVASVELPRSLEEIQEIVRRAARLENAVSVCGGRHAMGGQQFGTGTWLLDVSQHTNIHGLDATRGLVKVEAGIRWPELVAGLQVRQNDRADQWSIRQKQTGADSLSLGGALAANVHGRGLQRPPIIADVEAFTLVDAQGEVQVCSRSENADLFRLVIGGYGAFGIIADVTLRLDHRRKLERRVEIIGVRELMAAFDERITAGYEYGDFQFCTDERSPDFLARGVFSCYRPVNDDRPVPTDQAQLGAADWQRLLTLAHTDRRGAFAEYCRYYLTTDGQRYWSDTHQLGTYVENYHDEIDRRSGTGYPGSEMITELYVPRGRLAEFLGCAGVLLREHAATVIYGTVRLIERDTESFLTWATESFACIIFNLHVDHTPTAVDDAARAFRALIDLATAFDGSFYLTYHRWATRTQVDACYPQFAEWLSLQRRHDPAGRWQSDWLRHYRRVYAPAAPAAGSRLHC